jgi:hypothetical protein
VNTTHLLCQSFFFLLSVLAHDAAAPGWRHMSQHAAGGTQNSSCVSHSHTCLSHSFQAGAEACSSQRGRPWLPLVVDASTHKQLPCMDCSPCAHLCRLCGVSERVILIHQQSVCMQTCTQPPNACAVIPCPVAGEGSCPLRQA